MDWFSRVPPDFRPAIQAAKELLPLHVEQLCRPRFLCGVSPLFVGLHRYETTEDGRSYHDTAHAIFEGHAVDGATTIALPEPVDVGTVLHELGHVYDEATHFEFAVPTTTPYSDNDRYERVAEAFKLLLLPDYGWRGEWLDYLGAEEFRPFRESLA